MTTEYKQLHSRLLSCIFFSCMLFSCQKQAEWLDAKQNKDDAVPATIEEFQAILDNANVMNQSFPSFAYISSDNLFVPYASWQSRTTIERNLYIWAHDVYEGERAFDWNLTYRMIFHANVVIEGLLKASKTSGNQTRWNEVMGAALFYRAYGHLNLLQLFSPDYDPSTAPADLGTPLKLSSDVNDMPHRSSVHHSYQQVLRDLAEALQLLPEISAFQSRPSKPAVNALLARTYLLTENYPLALAHAGEALSANNTLINFNTLSATSARPFAAFPDNKEIIFYAESTSYAILAQSNFFADTTLFSAYHQNDLRRTIFFATGAGGYPAFKGTYTAKTNLFAGLATNELYLVAAESKARLGDAPGAMVMLNSLLQSRFKTGTFVPFVATSPADALTLVLLERRKELPFTGTLRWSDLKRLNVDSRYAVTLTRVLNNVPYSLPPNDKRYVLPIPDEEIKLSGIQQNPR